MQDASPSAKAPVVSHATVSMPSAYITASAIATAADAAWVTMSSPGRLRARAATAPARGPRNNTEENWAPTTTPTASAECVR
jgi:hypothetical protein